MRDDTLQTKSIPPPGKRPWQFSLLHLFGLTTMVAVCAASFSWGIGWGLCTVALVPPIVTALYRATGVVQAAPPSMRRHSFGNLLVFALVTSYVWSLAALVAFTALCAPVAFLAMRQTTPQTSVPLLALALVLGGAAASFVLYRSWPGPVAK